MAQNNVTEVVNGIVQPRLYQVYGDLIESKEVMEPISILAGSGPICGFDWVDTTKANLTIQSVWNATGGSDTFLKNLRNRARRVYIGTKENKAGHVYNAYTTPDGLIMVAPDTLTFNGVAPTGGWPNLSNPEKAVMFVLKATHSYRASADENPPSVTDFNAQWVQIDADLSDILAWNYGDMFENLIGDMGINFNHDTDVLIGLYIVGWNPSWDSDSESARLKSICAQINYTLCLNPYMGKFPVNPYFTNPLDVPDLKARVASLEGSVPGDVTKLNVLVDNLRKSLGSGVYVEVTREESVDDDDVFKFTKLNVRGSSFVNTTPVIKKINYQWYEGNHALGIWVSPDINVDQGITVPESKWDINGIRFGTNDQGTWIYEDLIPPYNKPNYKLVGVIMPQHIAINNTEVVNSGFSSDNPDAMFSWRLGMALGDLFNNRMINEEADSGILHFTPGGGSDQHYAYVKAIMNDNSITIRLVICLLNTSSYGVTALSYNLSTLFAKNPKMSSVLSDILRLKSNSESETNLYMAMPSTFKASDVDHTLSSVMDCEFQKYSARLSLGNTTATVIVELRGMNKSNGPSTFIELGHVITLPIRSKLAEKFAQAWAGNTEY